MRLLERAKRVRTTILVSTRRCPAKEARGGTMATGFEHGMDASYAQLDAIVAR